MRNAVGTADSELPVFNFVTMDDAVSYSFGAQRLATVRLGFFAGIVLLLSSLGLFALVTYSVSQRTREFGIRIDLGASPADIPRMTLTEGIRIALIGIGTGAIGSLQAIRAMRSLVFVIDANAPITFAAITLLTAVVTLAAILIPARRTIKVDPMAAMRCEY